MSSIKTVHSIILDAGPILNNDPSISTLLAKSELLFTVSSVISEIKDVNARSRVETTLQPFLTIRDPTVNSIKTVTEFAKKTGDLIVLSKADIQILALAYEIECERNGGDWRLRRNPGQKSINGPVPQKVETSPSEPISGDVVDAEGPVASSINIDIPNPIIAKSSDDAEVRHDPANNSAQQFSQDDELVESTSALQILDSAHEDCNQRKSNEIEHVPDTNNDAELSDAESSGSEGWITPSNLQRQQAKDMDASTMAIAENKIMQVATITTDFAMQNVLLQMGLNLLSPSIQQVRHIKSYILRCHACFQKTKDMTKQFCPSCGKPTLTRVSCSTNAKGEFQIYLKKNMQWNHRGDRYSIPKPVSGNAKGKVAQGKGGGKGGWGQDLILAEDQKEYVRAMSGQNRRKEKNLMDEDYLPSILTGDRGRAGGRPKVGAGRTVNSRKR